METDIPPDLSSLLEAMAADFPAILQGNLVGIYLWGSLTYDAFDETCSDVDCVALTRQDLDDREFAELDHWFQSKAEQNRWGRRTEMRFVIDKEQLDKTSRCCGYYQYTGKLIRHGSDGNAIIWMNVGQCGITLWGMDAKSVAPRVTDDCLNDGLQLELNYLTHDLASNAGSRSREAFVYNAYAVLTACRILYTAKHRTLASKEQACRWATETVAPKWRPIIQTARDNRLKNGGCTDPRLERDAMKFVEFVTNEVRRTP